MKKRIKIISADRAVHIIDGLLFAFQERFIGGDGKYMSTELLDTSKKERDEYLETMLHKIYMVAHTCSRPSCEDAHQHWIPEIRQIERDVIKAGFCSPLNKRGWKARIREQKRNAKLSRSLRDD